jgi:hypothetical protein
MELAATVIEEAEREFRDDEFGAQIGILVPASATEYLGQHLPNRVAEVEDDYLTDSHGGLSHLIGLASGHFPEPLYSNECSESDDVFRPLRRGILSRSTIDDEAAVANHIRGKDSGDAALDAFLGHVARLLSENATREIVSTLL